MGIETEGIELTPRFFPATPPTPEETFRDARRDVAVVSLQRGDHRLTYHLSPDDSYTVTLARKQTLFWGNQLATVKSFTLRLRASDEHSEFADELKRLKHYIAEILRPLASKSFFGDAWNNPTLSYKKLIIATALYNCLADDTKTTADKCATVADLFARAAELQGERGVIEDSYPQGKLGSILFNVRRRIDSDFRERHAAALARMLERLSQVCN